MNVITILLLDEGVDVMTYDKRRQDLRTRIKKTIKKDAPDLPSVDSCECGGEKMIKICLVHPPMKLEGAHAEMLVALLDFFKEMGLNPKDLMDWVLKSGVWHVHKEIAEIVKIK